jgi:hypothetical protein
MSEPLCPVCEEKGFDSWHGVVNHLVQEHHWQRDQCICGEGYWIDRGYKGGRLTLADHLEDQKDVVLHVALERVGRKKERERYVTSGAIMSGMIGGFTWQGWSGQGYGNLQSGAGQVITFVSGMLCSGGVSMGGWTQRVQSGAFSPHVWSGSI